MNNFDVTVTILGAMILVLILVSRRLTKSPVPPTLIAFAIGILIGPKALGLVDFTKFDGTFRLLEQLARLTLGMGLVGTALSIRREYLKKHWKSPAVLIVFAMILMWVFGTFLVYVVLRLPLWVAALIGAIIAPTDPIASSAIVTGKVAEENIPERLRDTISFESGANDGFGFPFVMLPFLMLTLAPGEALREWVVDVILWQVIFATLVGVFIGYALGKLLMRSSRLGIVNDTWRLSYAAALALAAIGVGRLIRSDEVLVAFAAGAAFSLVMKPQDREKEEYGHNAVDRFFEIPIFTVIGTMLPWDGWASLGWAGILLAVLVLFLRRPPALLLLRRFVPAIHDNREALFLGWFGPVTVAALYYSALMDRELGNPLVWPVVSLIITSSVLVHGVTAAPFTLWFGRATKRKSDRR